MKKIIKYFLIPLFIFIIFFTFYNNVYKKISILYWDEDGWLGRGYFFELLIKGDFNNQLWDTPLAFNQPKLTEYMYGAAIYPTYLKYKEKLSKKNIDYAQFFIDHNFYQVDGEKYEKYKENNYQFIDWEKGKFVDFDASASQLVNKYGQNFQKTIDLIFTARKINVYLLSLNVVIVYYISVFCFGLFPSLLISLLFGSNNFIIEACLKAHSEGLFLFLFNLDLLILILTVKKNRLFSILFAIVTGLLWQTKINGVMMLIIFNTVFLTKMAINWFKSNKKIVGHILLLFNVNSEKLPLALCEAEPLSEIAIKLALPFIMLPPTIIYGAMASKQPLLIELPDIIPPELTVKLPANIKPTSGLAKVERRTPETVTGPFA